MSASNDTPRPPTSGAPLLPMTQAQELEFLRKKATERDHIERSRIAIQESRKVLSAADEAPTGKLGKFTSPPAPDRT